MSQNETSLENTVQRACQRIATGLVVRYGNPLFTRIHGDLHEFARTLAKVLETAGITAEDCFALRDWLQQGLRPFSDYPPQIEILLHLSYLIKTYPLTEYQKKIKHVWYGLDTTYGQTYFRNWRNDKPIDEMARERVWLSAFDKMQLTESQISQAIAEFSDCGLFRQYPPTLEQFQDAILAIRQNAPLIEMAWLESANKITTSTHPMVVQARSQIGAHDLNTHKRDRDMENRFKSIYRKLLSGEASAVAPVIATEQEIVRDYEDTENLAQRLKDW
jgi:hypothetical protein